MRTNRYSVLMAESSEMVAEGVKAFLDPARFDLLAPLSDVLNLESRIAVQKPDILLLNPTLLPSPPKAALNQLQSLRPRMAVVALVYHYTDPLLLASFRGVLDINTPSNKVSSLLLDAVQETQEAADDTTQGYDLSERETGILVLVAKGLSSKEIADKLSLSVHTVNTHRKNITHKTGIRSVAGLAVYAMLHNLM